MKRNLRDNQESGFILLLVIIALVIAAVFFFGFERVRNNAKKVPTPTVHVKVDLE